MDGSRLSPYPNLSWLSYGLHVHPPRAFTVHDFKAVAHRLLLTEEGDADLVWTVGVADIRCHLTDGTVGFFPCDSALHSLGITTAGGYRGTVILVPHTHLESICEAEGTRSPANAGARPALRDALLLACTRRLLAGGRRGHPAEDVGAEIAARQLIMRLATLTGGRLPEWSKDTSVFSPRMMTLIVEHVDAHLGVRLTLDHISSGFGLSPSHFARKFQRSTGLSLNRFMNRRRIGLALALLKTGGASLAQMSLDLGFSSQSHFTRLFSGLTGLTPFQFRRSQRRMSDC